MQSAAKLCVLSMIYQHYLKRGNKLSQAGGQAGLLA